MKKKNTKSAHETIQKSSTKQARNEEQTMLRHVWILGHKKNLLVAKTEFLQNVLHDKKKIMMRPFLQMQQPLLQVDT